MNDNRIWYNPNLETINPLSMLIEQLFEKIKNDIEEITKTKIEICNKNGR